MPKNTGTPSQSAFEAVWKRLGSRAFCYRIADAAEVKGRTGKIGKTRPTPSDFIVTFNGVTEYAEVKSTHNPTSFPFSNLEVGQKSAAVQILAAGGEYNVYVHRLPESIWYKIPYLLIRDSEKKSLAWTQLETNIWNPPT